MSDEPTTALWGAKAAVKASLSRLLPHRLGVDQNQISALENVGKRENEEDTATRPRKG